MFSDKGFINNRSNHCVKFYKHTINFNLGFDVTNVNFLSVNRANKVIFVVCGKLNQRVKKYQTLITLSRWCLLTKIIDLYDCCTTVFCEIINDFEICPGTRAYSFLRLGIPAKNF